MRPTVSIIVPMRNAERYVSRALSSILSETKVALEVIVVDDHSTDSSRERIAKLRDSRVRLLHGSNRGIAASMNAGLAEARGSIIMRCDADDVYPETRISRQIEWLNDNLEMDAVCGGFSTIDSNGAEISDMPCGDARIEITNELANGSIRTHLCTYAIRSTLALKVEGFREYFETAEDLDYQLRLSGHGRVLYVPENWYLYRIHSSSITHTQQTTRRQYFECQAIDFQNQRRKFGSDDLQKGATSRTLQLQVSSASDARNHIQGMLLGRAWREHTNGKKFHALTTGTRAVMTDPRSVAAWKSLVSLIIKPTGFRYPNK